MNNLIIVTDWKKVDKDNFYVSSEWLLKEHDEDKLEEVKALLDI